MNHGGRAQISDNVAWTLEKGSWLMHLNLTIVANVVFRTFFDRDFAYQLTLFTYNIVTFIFFHWIIGDPFNYEFGDYTFWEQLYEQVDHSQTLAFFLAYPVGLFFFCNHLTVWRQWTFYFGIFTLSLVVIPKLGFMHRRRLFGLKIFH